MRQISFLLFFALCLSLALFSIENTQTAAINLVPGVQLEAPLSIELLLAAGAGSLLVWLFSLWDQLQRRIDSWDMQRKLKEKNKKIEELEQTLAEFQAEDAEDESTVVEETSEVPDPEPEATEDTETESDESSDSDSEDVDKKAETE